MRSSGVLMHITSLPGPYGVGAMGKEAFAFVDFLKAAGQSWWQILPLTPTGYGDSPYQSWSAFAGNHYLIDLEALIADGLLERQEVDAIHWCDIEDKANFGLLYQNRYAILSLAYSRFRGSREFEDFCIGQSDWLPDAALFMALKERSGGKPWYQWQDGLKFRKEDALREAREQLSDQIRFYSFAQFLFFRQWNALRAYAHKNGVSIIGDVPIYVPLDSVETWVNPELFQLDAQRMPTAVAGCPPDGFSEDGQLWGNPLYRWDVMEKDGYAWWLRRLRFAGRMYDRIRLDHFRGFESYWAVPYGEKTARNGQWCKGPGASLFRAVEQALPQLPLIAEDLGFMTPEVIALREEFGYPGMKVLQFAFGSREPSADLPHVYPHNCVCYTGTHDNMTMRQWFESVSEDSVSYAAEYMALSPQEGLVWGTIRTAFASVADLCIVPMQDLLNLGEDGRMNFPGTLSDSNWTWRIKDDIIKKRLSERLYCLTALYDRLGGQARPKGELLMNKIGELEYEL